MILVTGSTGFIGCAVAQGLRALNRRVRFSVRGKDHITVPGFYSDSVAVGEIGPNTDWSTSLVGVDCVIHCASRAHVRRETEANPLAVYRSTNVRGLQQLAEQAVDAGVRRLIYISSIKVNGERTIMGTPFSFRDTPAPEDPYGISKWEAERALWEISARKGLEIVVIRPPLVYGPGVKGNFARLLYLLRAGLPLPLAAVNNRRSFVGLDNLVDVLIRCVDHPKAAGQTLLVSDGQDLSTPQLLRMIARAMGRPARLFPVPTRLLRIAGRALGRLDEVDRLVGSLQVDISATRELLSWTPPVSVEEGVERMVMGTHKA